MSTHILYCTFKFVLDFFCYYGILFSYNYTNLTFTMSLPLSDLIADLIIAWLAGDKSEWCSDA